MQDPALDNTGEQYPNVYTGAPMLINEETEYVTRQQEETDALPGKAVAVPVRYAITSLPSSKPCTVNHDTAGLLTVAFGLTLLLESQTQ